MGRGRGAGPPPRIKSGISAPLPQIPKLQPPESPLDLTGMLQSPLCCWGPALAAKGPLFLPCMSIYQLFQLAYTFSGWLVLI